jgi:hypothetical protein
MFWHRLRQKSFIASQQDVKHLIFCLIKVNFGATSFKDLCPFWRQNVLSVCPDFSLTSQTGFSLADQRVSVASAETFTAVLRCGDSACRPESGAASSGIEPSTRRFSSTAANRRGTVATRCQPSYTLFSSSPLRQNKLECLSLTSFQANKA